MLPRRRPVTPIPLYVRGRLHGSIESEYKMDSYRRPRYVWTYQFVCRLITRSTPIETHLKKLVLGVSDPFRKNFAIF